MTKFPEAAIRKRLEAGYRHSNPRNGRGTVMFDEAIRDVAACLKEIDELRPKLDWMYHRAGFGAWADYEDWQNSIRSTSGKV